MTSRITPVQVGVLCYPQSGPAARRDNPLKKFFGRSELLTGTDALRSSAFVLAKAFVLLVGVCGATFAVGQPFLPPGYLGITTKSSGSNLIVESVRANSPAEAAGLIPGDRIVGLRGSGINPNAPYLETLRTLPAGAAVQMDVISRGRMRTVDVAMALRPDEPPGGTITGAEFPNIISPRVIGPFPNVPVDVFPDAGAPPFAEVPAPPLSEPMIPSVVVPADRPTDPVPTGSDAPRATPVPASSDRATGRLPLPPLVPAGEIDTPEERRDRENAALPPLPEIERDELLPPRSADPTPSAEPPPPAALDSLLPSTPTGTTSPEPVASAPGTLNPPVDLPALLGLEEWQMTVSTTLQTISRDGGEPRTGILIAALTPESPLAVGGVRSDAIVTKIEGQPITGLPQFLEQLKSAPTERPTRIEFFQNGIFQATTVVRPPVEVSSAPAVPPARESAQGIPAEPTSGRRPLDSRAAPTRRPVPKALERTPAPESADLPPESLPKTAESSPDVAPPVPPAEMPESGAIEPGPLFGEFATDGEAPLRLGSPVEGRRDSPPEGLTVDDRIFGDDGRPSPGTDGSSAPRGTPSLLDSARRPSTGRASRPTPSTGPVVNPYADPTERTGGYGSLTLDPPALSSDRPTRPRVSPLEESSSENGVPPRVAVSPTVPPVSNQAAPTTAELEKVLAEMALLRDRIYILEKRVHELEGRK